MSDAGDASGAVGANEFVICDAASCHLVGTKDKKIVVAVSGLLPAMTLWVSPILSAFSSLSNLGSTGNTFVLPHRQAVQTSILAYGGVESNSGARSMENQEYINPFRDVHRKAKALKERVQEELRKDEELRKKQQIQEAESLLKARDGF